MRFWQKTNDRLLTLLLLLLCLCIVVNEYMLPYVHIENCFYPQKLDDSYLFKNTTELRVMLLSDPQLIGDTKEFPTLKWLRKISQWDSDRYMRNSFTLAVKKYNPDLIIVLGDAMDEGFTATDEEFERYRQRLMSVFENHGDAKLIIMAGDNDIGGEGNDLQNDQVIDRFEKAFGKVNRLVTIGRVTFVLYNSLSYLDRQPTSSIKVTKFLQTAGEQRLAREEKEEKMRQMHAKSIIKLRRVRNAKLPIAKDVRNAEIVLSHVPMQELPLYARELILESVRPDAIFSGHSHLYRQQEYTSRNKAVGEAQVKKFPTNEEIHDKLMDTTVPTFSYRMGTNQMGFVLSRIQVRDHAWIDEELLREMMASSKASDERIDSFVKSMQSTNVQIHSAICALPDRFTAIFVYLTVASVIVGIGFWRFFWTRIACLRSNKNASEKTNNRLYGPKLA